jgi:hypothetical protein
MNRTELDWIIGWGLFLTGTPLVWLVKETKLNLPVRMHRCGNFGQGAMVVDPEAPSPAIMAGGVGSAVGRELENLAEGQQSEKYFSLVHPTEKRKFSIAELKRICAFPDDDVPNRQVRERRYS